uniref:Uncharacterized protein n=1 Tax=Hyaloperonospora arabidopsidis (strain Emoy2) TaxID=559515 RepID=M4BV86_HYAAE
MRTDDCCAIDETCWKSHHTTLVTHRHHCRNNSMFRFRERSNKYCKNSLIDWTIATWVLPCNGSHDLIEDYLRHVLVKRVTVRFVQNRAIC